jgi:hypothetical protein
MRTSLPARTGRNGRLALPASLLILVVMSCGHPPHDSFGNVDVLVTVPADVLVNAVDFRISGPDSELVSGQIHSRSPQEEFETLVTHVPVGNEQTIDVTAKSIDGLDVCTGTSSLEVRKGATTRVHVALDCHGVHDGVVHIVVGVACPQSHLASYAISPLSVSVGGMIDVAAVDQDADAGALRYAWTATTGTFSDPNANATTYRCVAPGQFAITLVVVAGSCQETYSTNVTCSAPDAAGTD